MGLAYDSRSGGLVDFGSQWDGIWRAFKYGDLPGNDPLFRREIDQSTQPGPGVTRF